LVEHQHGEGGLAAARLAGDRDRRRAVPRRREHRVEVHDRAGSAQRLADVRADPADAIGDPVAELHGRGRHAPAIVYSGWRCT